MAPPKRKQSRDESAPCVGRSCKASHTFSLLDLISTFSQKSTPKISSKEENTSNERSESNPDTHMDGRPVKVAQTQGWARLCPWRAREPLRRDGTLLSLAGVTFL